LSLKRNIIANYIGQIYVTLVGILMLPFYIKYMGAEAYGLVGFFTMLQAWFNLLDLGLTPTIGRETARYHGGAMPALQFRQLFRMLSVIFAVIAVLGGGALFLLADRVATHWLHVVSLPLSTVILSLQIMALSIAMRWMGGLYRGVITGAEQLQWLSGFNALIATLRFIVVLPVMAYYGYTPIVFFVFQLAVAALEFIGLGLKSLQLLPARRLITAPIGWSLQPIRPLLKFALTIAFTSSVWVLVTQTDKLVLSGILPLAAYGYFTLAVLVASGIMVVSGPISTAIMPRMARLHSEQQHDELIAVYRSATQLVSIIAGAAAITLAFCAEPLLYAWTGNAQLATSAAPILRLYAIGNGFLAIGAFPYYLQYARGTLRYHLLGNLGMVIVLIPSLILAAQHYGGVGAGIVWALMNMLYLLIWVGYVHHRLEPTLHGRWISEDVLWVLLPPLLAVSVVAGGLSLLHFSPISRLANISYVMAIGAIALGGALLGSKSARALIKSRLLRKV
jgi:O-antigen/teichoic acid export membrane protein